MASGGLSRLERPPAVNMHLGRVVICIAGGKMQAGCAAELDLPPAEMLQGCGSADSLTGGLVGVEAGLCRIKLPRGALSPSIDAQAVAAPQDADWAA